MKRLIALISAILITASVLFGCTGERPNWGVDNYYGDLALDSIPSFEGETPYAVINHNEPYFTEEDLTTD